MNEISVSLSVDSVGSIALALDESSAEAALGLGEPYIGGQAEDYAGPYGVVPSSEAQVLDTKWLRMTDDVTVAPIPSNYGLITWDGSSLMVSSETEQWLRTSRLTV